MTENVKKPAVPQASNPNEKAAPTEKVVELKDGGGGNATRKQLQVYLEATDDVENVHLPTIEEAMTAQTWSPQGRVIAICANVTMRTEVLCDWDIALTMSGSYVYTPPNTAAEGFSQDYFSLADFVMNKKIDQASSVLVITNHQGCVDDFMVPWVMHAFNSGKEVFVNTKLRGLNRNDGKETVVGLLRVNVLALLRPHYLYRLDREMFEHHLRYKQHLDLSASQGKQIDHEDWAAPPAE